MNQTTTKNGNFIRGATILGIAGIIVKILGALFKIPLSRMIGSEGMGYYTTAFSFYTICLTVFASGFSIAISKMISDQLSIKNTAEAQNIFRVSRRLLLLEGLVITVLLVVFAGEIATWLGNADAGLPLRTLSSAMLFVPVMAAYRGYFQGKNNMQPSAVSQIFEQFFRAISGLFFAILFFPYGFVEGAGGATLGTVVGAAAGLLVIIVIYHKEKKRHLRPSAIESPTVQPARSIVKQLFLIAVPITIGNLAVPLINITDVFVSFSRLHLAGFSLEQSNQMLGQLSGMASTLINLPQVITAAIGTSIIPIIANLSMTKQSSRLTKEISLAFKLTSLIAFPAMAGLFVLSGPIIRILFPKEPASVGQMLAILSFGVFFLSMMQTITAILQGLGKSHIPVINLFVGLGVKVLLAYVLVAQPAIHIFGAALGTVVAYAVACILDYAYLIARFRIHVPVVDTFLKGFFAAVVMGGAVYLIYQAMLPIMGLFFSTGISILVGVLLYSAVLIGTKTIRKEELMSLKK